VFIDAITTPDVCRDLGWTEPKLRHVLRRPGAPRPRLHPTARLFLWTREDIERLAAFIRKPSSSRTSEAGRG